MHFRFLPGSALDHFPFESVTLAGALGISSLTRRIAGSVTHSFARNLPPLISTRGVKMQGGIGRLLAYRINIAWQQLMPIHEISQGASPLNCGRVTGSLVGVLEPLGGVGVFSACTPWAI